MKNLRPEGARAEEVQEAPTREEAKRSTETEEGEDQERRQEVRGQAAHNQPAREQAEFKFKYLWPSGCGAVSECREQPAKLQYGDWPKVRCPACGKAPRIGKSRCCWCTRQLSICACTINDQEDRFFMQAGAGLAQEAPAKPYSFLGATGCGSVITWPEKPKKSQTTRPIFRCETYGGQFRRGRCRCCECSQELGKCLCKVSHSQDLAETF